MHNVIRTCSQATYFFTYTNCSLPFVYLTSKEVSTGLRYQYIDGLVQDCSNSIANALELPQSCTKPSACTWKFKTGHCHAECNVPALWPPSYFEDLLHDKLFLCVPFCNLPFCRLTGNSFVTFVENCLLITPIYFVIDAPIHSDWYTLRRCQMTVMPSRITCQSSIRSTFSSDKQHRNIKGPYYRPFVKGIHRWIPPTRGQ